MLCVYMQTCWLLKLASWLQANARLQCQQAVAIVRAAALHQQTIARVHQGQKELVQALSQVCICPGQHWHQACAVQQRADHSIAEMTGKPAAVPRKGTVQRPHKVHQADEVLHIIHKNSVLQRADACCCATDSPGQRTPHAARISQVDPLRRPDRKTHSTAEHRAGGPLPDLAPLPGHRGARHSTHKSSWA